MTHRRLLQRALKLQAQLGALADRVSALKYDCKADFPCQRGDLEHVDSALIEALDMLAEAVDETICTSPPLPEIERGNFWGRTRILE